MVVKDLCKEGKANKGLTSGLVGDGLLGRAGHTSIRARGNKLYEASVNSILILLGAGCSDDCLVAVVWAAGLQDHRTALLATGK